MVTRDLAGALALAAGWIGLAMAVYFHYRYPRHMLELYSLVGDRLAQWLGIHRIRPTATADSAGSGLALTLLRAWALLLGVAIAGGLVALTFPGFLGLEPAGRGTKPPGGSGPDFLVGVPLLIFGAIIALCGLCLLTRPRRVTRWIGEVFDREGPAKSTSGSDAVAGSDEYNGRMAVMAGVVYAVCGLLMMASGLLFMLG